MNEPKNDDRYVALFIGLVIAVCVAWVLFAIFGRNVASIFGFGLSSDEAGKFGDSFGGVNALFTALAFCALVVTVLMQRRDLHLQREELRYTREELRGQKEAMASQNLTLQRQNVDNRLFQMLSFHHAITEAIDIKTKDSSRDLAKGRDSFRFFYGALRENYRIARNAGPPVFGFEPQASRIQAMLSHNQYRDHQKARGLPTDPAMEFAYMALFDQHQGDLGHYFRNLYHVFRMIDESDLSMRDKRRFSNIARAQLSSYETALLFYNGLTPYGYQKFWPLMEQYGLLKNFDYALLLDDSHRSLYFIGATIGSPTRYPDEVAIGGTHKPKSDRSGDVEART